MPAWKRCGPWTPAGASRCRPWTRCWIASEPASRSISRSNAAHEAPYEGLEAQALEAVEKRGLLERTLFSSFHDGVLARLRELSPRSRIAFLVSPRDASRPLERARAVGAEALNPWLGLARADRVESAHAVGLAVNVFTVDEIDDMRRLLELGVDGLFTNHPARLRQLIGPRGAEARSDQILTE